MTFTKSYGGEFTWVGTRAKIDRSGLITFIYESEWTAEELEIVIAKSRDLAGSPKDSNGVPMIPGRQYLVWREGRDGRYLDGYMRYDGRDVESGVTYQLVEAP